MLISDKQIKINVDFKESVVPNSIKEQLPFPAKYGYILNAIASDRKENITKEMAPEWYKILYLKIITTIDIFVSKKDLKIITIKKAIKQRV
mgnify:CR=1 FL=1